MPSPSLSKRKDSGGSTLNLLWVMSRQFKSGEFLVRQKSGSRSLKSEVRGKKRPTFKKVGLKLRRCFFRAARLKKHLFFKWAITQKL